MAGDEMEHPVRATTASIDRRVERLELLQAETDRKVDALVLTVEHLRELMGLKFTGLEQSLQAHGVKLDAFIMKIESYMDESVRIRSDIDALPIGRAINKRITNLEERAEKADNFMTTARGLGYIISVYAIPAIAIVVSAAALARSFGVF